MIPTCTICGRHLGDVHHLHCPTRSETNWYVEEHHCTTNNKREPIQNKEYYITKEEQNDQ